MARKPEPSTPDRASFSIFTEVRAWLPDWTMFADQHSPWLNGFPADEPIYLLPKTAIRRLARSKKGTGFIPPSFVDSEFAFTALCEASQAVGVWREQPIHYDPLTNRQRPQVPTEIMEALNWSEDQQRRQPKESKAAEEPRRRLLGVAGWLLTEPAFLSQTDALRSLWNEFPPDERPSFPLCRARPVTKMPDDSVAANRQMTAFLSRCDEFLDRWDLLRMTTWDLPVPQGPLLPGAAPASASATPTHGVHVVLPVHYPVQDNDGLIRQILESQKRIAEQMGIDSSFAGLPHSDIYGQIFETLHLERAIRSRERPGHTLHGEGPVMEAAIASCVHVEVASVQKYRKAISACLKGQRSEISWLQPAERRTRPASHRS